MGLSWLWIAGVVLTLEAMQRRAAAFSSIVVVSRPTVIPEGRAFGPHLTSRDPSRGAQGRQWVAPRGAVAWQQESLCLPSTLVVGVGILLGSVFAQISRRRRGLSGHGPLALHRGGEGGQVSRNTRVGARRWARMQPGLPDAGIALVERSDLKSQMKEQFDNEKWWRVLLHNDDIHTFEYVTGCITRVVKHLTRRKAYNITWEAHSSGKATLACVWKPLAEQFCVNLQQLGLTVSIAPDSKFEGSKGG